MIILDTNILSEIMRPEPSVKVMEWLRDQPVLSFYITTITQAEIFYCIALLPSSERRTKLHKTAIAMFREDFNGRILSFDLEAAEMFAEIASNRQQAGQPISQFDAQISAIARSRGAGVATRNDRDFLNCGIDVINPWSS